MIVAVGPVRVVQVLTHQVVDVVTVRDGLVAARRPVHVAGLVIPAAVCRRAGVGVGGANRDDVFVDVGLVREMQVPVVQVVGVTVVTDGGVAAP
jgi:hypothetical protein